MTDKGKNAAVEISKDEKKAALAKKAEELAKSRYKKPFRIIDQDTRMSETVASPIMKIGQTPSKDATKIPIIKIKKRPATINKPTTEPSAEQTVAAVSAEPAQSTHVEADMPIDTEVDSEETIVDESTVVAEKETAAINVKYSKRGKLPFRSGHNQIANLETEIVGIGRIAEMMKFLKESKIGKAISCDPLVFKQQIEDFWNTATVVVIEKKEFICARVSGIPVQFGEADLRRVLEFGDKASDPEYATKNKVRKCAMRCGYPDAKNEVKKKFFDPAFKYFVHILILCLSSRKAGTDSANEELMNIMASIMMNMRLNITRIIWGWMIKAAKNPVLDFLLYPRFVQVLLNENPEPIVQLQDEVLRVEKIAEGTVLSMLVYKSMDRPSDAKFWGAMVNKDYICPVGDAVDHGADSDCELEVIDVELPAKKQTKKRKAEEHLDQSLQVLYGEPPKQRRHAALTSRPKLNKDGSFVKSSIPAPSTSSRAKQPESGITTPQPDLSELTMKMTTLSLDVTNMREEAQRKEEEAAQEKQSLEQRLAVMEQNQAMMMQKQAQSDKDMAKVLEKMKNLKFKNKLLSKKNKLMEKVYDRNAVKMAIDRKGYYRWHTEVADDDLYDIPEDSPIELSESESSGTDAE